MRFALYELAGGTDRLPELRDRAAKLGLVVAVELVDRAGAATVPRPALRDLRQRFDDRGLEGVLTPGLAHLLRSTAEAGSVLLFLLDRGVAIVTLDGLDTRDLSDHIRLREGGMFVRDLSVAIRSRAAIAGLSSVRPSRHSQALVPEQHLADLWHRGLSLREIAAEMQGILKSSSCSTLRRYLAVLREAGTLSPERRAEALVARGGLRKGGRPRRRVSVDLAQLRELLAAGKSAAETLRTLQVRRGKLTRSVLRRLVRSIEEERP